MRALALVRRGEVLVRDAQARAEVVHERARRGGRGRGGERVVILGGGILERTRRRRRLDRGGDGRSDGGRARGARGRGHRASEARRSACGRARGGRRGEGGERRSITRHCGETTTGAPALVQTPSHAARVGSNAPLFPGRAPRADAARPRRDRGKKGALLEITADSRRPHPPRTMGDDASPPPARSRSRSPPARERSRSPARSPPRGGSSPRGGRDSRSRSRSPRRDDPPRYDSRERSPGRGGGGARKFGVAGRWNPRGFGACRALSPPRANRPNVRRRVGSASRDAAPDRRCRSVPSPRARTHPRAKISTGLCPQTVVFSDPIRSTIHDQTPPLDRPPTDHRDG